MCHSQELGVYHRAGSHFILAHSPDCYVHHGREAVRLYKQLKVETPSQEKHKAGLVAWAEQVLEKAERDAAELAANPLTEEEYQEHMEEYYKRVEEQEEAWKKFELEGEPEEGVEEKPEEEPQDVVMHEAASSGDSLEVGAEVTSVEAQGAEMLHGGGFRTPPASQQSTTTALDPIGEGLLEAEQTGPNSPESKQ